MNTSVHDATLFEYKEFIEEEGKLVPITGEEGITFPIKRIFYAWDVPNGTVRGKHAHHRCSQILICLKGTLLVTVDDGTQSAVHILDDPKKALYIPSGIWSQEEYRNNAVMLALASHKYAKADYINDYDDFVDWKRS
jgi:UDP-2-acetamido-3-amino-2,3-dideoxy-glucuronate N-acetyltransferase